MTVPRKTIISILESATVLVVEDSIERRHFFLSSYRIPQAFVEHVPHRANRLIHDLKPDVVFLDYDLLDGTVLHSSEPVALFLNAIDFNGQVYIHSADDFGRQVLKRILPQAHIIPWGEFEITRTRGWSND